MLPIEFLTTKRFRDAISDVGCKLYIPNGRINFESGLGKKPSGCAFGSIIIRIQDTFEIELINKNKLIKEVKE